jgi:hypothetical protein
VELPRNRVGKSRLFLQPTESSESLPTFENLLRTNNFPAHPSPFSKRLAQGKLVDAILPGGVLSVSKSTLVQ